MYAENRIFEQNRGHDRYLDSAFPLTTEDKRDHDNNDLKINEQYDAKNTTEAWNYFHINSIDKDDQGNYLISARNYRAVFKINGTTGDIIWQLGGLHNSSFYVPKNVEFAFQHDARFRSRSENGQIDVISFFDNAAHTSPGWDISPFSRGRFVQLNHTSGEASEIATFPAPFGLSAHSQGNLQHLPNGNVFINWGQAGAVTEFAWDGEVLFHAFLDSEPAGKLVQSYRGFRGNWTGTPVEEPAIVALRGSGDEGLIAVYVSWNGDTETAAWRLYLETGVEGVKARTLLGEVGRKSFETEFDIHNSAIHGLDADSKFFAKAVDKHGIVLVTTRAVVAEKEIEPYGAARVHQNFRVQMQVQEELRQLHSV
jgi:hypothetical protein